MPITSGIYYSVHEGGEYHQPGVVLLHGAGGSYLNWPAEIRRMAGQNVLALDLPGHGRSTGYAQQSITAYAEQVHDFLSELGMGEVVLVGHSLGGAVALTLALKYPRMVAGLGLISTGAAINIDPTLISALTNPTTVSEGLAWLQASAFSPATSVAQVEAAMRGLREIRPSLLLSDYVACSHFDLREMADQIDAPAWVACGADDRLTPPALTNYLAGRLPNARAQIIPAAGHMVTIEQPGLLAQGLQSFLTEGLPAIQEYRFALHRRYAPARKNARED